MRYKLRKDDLHSEITRELIQAGFSVADTSRVGHGYPDLTISRNNVTALCELKTRRGRKCAEDLRNPAQIAFALAWKGPIIVAFTASEVIHDFNLLMKRRQAYAM